MRETKSAEYKSAEFECAEYKIAHFKIADNKIAEVKIAGNKIADINIAHLNCAHCAHSLTATKLHNFFELIYFLSGCAHLCDCFRLNFTSSLCETIPFHFTSI